MFCSSIAVLKIPQIARSVCVFFVVVFFVVVGFLSFFFQQVNGQCYVKSGYIVVNDPEKV